jgi:PRC-barrel domain
MTTSTTGTGSGGVATDETEHLISSSKVEGTAVYDRQGERLGTVSSFMVNKFTGQVAYAVMSFGGFLGLGQSCHPLPWRVLSYDPKVGGYVVDLDKDTLKAGPSYAASASPTWDRSYSEWIDRHYGVSPYWGDTSSG